MTNADGIDFFGSREIRWNVVDYRKESMVEAMEIEVNSSHR